MALIDKSKPVLVTGATGYVASWIIKQLLEEGYTVHAAVRDPSKKEKIAHLNKIAQQEKGTIKYFKSDLLVDGSYEEAMQGCELIYHTASPFTTIVKNPQKDLIEPAVNGTENVLKSASKVNSVKRIVLTSSCIAMYTDAIEAENAPNGTITENMWSTTSSLDYQPYAYSKTLAEKKAWELANNQNQWDLISLNPSFVLGPVLNCSSSTSESISILKQFGDGTLRFGAPRLGIGVVDVRDLAEAHVKAGFTAGANGRYIVSGSNTDFVEMGKLLEERFGSKYPIPKNALPKWLLLLVGPLANKLFTKKFVRNNVDRVWKGDSSRVQKELSIRFRPLQQTMEDAFQVLVDEKVI